MKKALVLIKNDLRHVFRDQMMVFFFFVPVLIIMGIYLLIPELIAVYPVLQDYQQYFVMLAAVQTSIMFGFIYAFLFLEEKDQEVLQAIRILPIAVFWFIAYRLLLATLLSMLGAFLTILLCGLAYPGFLKTLLLALLYGFNAPLMALLVGTFARNKVEGMAWFKGVNLFVILPITGFIIPATKYLFLPFPSYWTFLLFEKSLQINQVGLYFLAGILVHGVVLCLVYLQFSKRVFGR